MTPIDSPEGTEPQPTADIQERAKIIKDMYLQRAREITPSLKGSESYGDYSNWLSVFTNNEWYYAPVVSFYGNAKGLKPVTVAIMPDGTVHTVNHDYKDGVSVNFESWKTKSGQEYPLISESPPPSSGKTIRFSIYNFNNNDRPSGNYQYLIFAKEDVEKRWQIVKSLEHRFNTAVKAK